MNIQVEIYVKPRKKILIKANCVDIVGHDTDRYLSP